MRPITFSEWTFSYRHAAVFSLGKATIQKKEIANKLLPLLNEKENDDVVLRLFTLRSLTKLNVRSNEVIKRVKSRLKDSNGTVAYQAKTTLRELTTEKKKQ